MPMLQVSYNPTTRVALIQLDNAAVPGGSVDIGSFNHPDPVYPDSVVAFHGVRDLLYKRKPNGTPGFFPENITDMDKVKLQYAAGVIPVALAKITFPNAAESVAVGATKQLVPSFLPNDATNKTLTYASSVPGNATVTNGGLITGVATGTTVITATNAASGKTATVNVTVVAA